MPISARPKLPLVSVFLSNLQRTSPSLRQPSWPSTPPLGWPMLVTLAAAGEHCHKNSPRTSTEFGARHCEAALRYEGYSKLDTCSTHWASLQFSSGPVADACLRRLRSRGPHKGHVARTPVRANKPATTPDNSPQTAQERPWPQPPHFVGY